MIDFPSSPTVGQLYVGSNGVTYQWNGTLWLTNSAGGAGAVQAGGGTFTPTTNADAVINFPTLINGNTGNWLNLVNGRYTPPPGRYFLQVTHGVQAPAGSNGTWTLVPRKNGVRIPNAGASGSGGPQFSIPLTVGVYIDANGTDYFDWVGNVAIAGMNNQGGGVTAFPLSGLSGPPGPIGAGALSLYQEVLLAAAAIDMRVSWPTGARKIEIEYLALNVGNVADSVSFRAMLNGVPNTAAAYNTQFVYGAGSSAVGGQNVSISYWQGLAGMIITKGTLRPAVQSTQSYIEGTTWASSASQTYAMTQGHSGTPGANMNGLQMFNSGGNQFAPGSFLRCYVVP